MHAASKHQHPPTVAGPSRPGPAAPVATPPARRRVLIVDDHPLFRDGVRLWIGRQPDMECCGEADSVASARESITAQKPDLVLLDLFLGTEDGFQTISSLRASFPRVPMLVMAEQEELVLGPRVLHAGAQGYVMKREPGPDLVGALRRVLGGEVHVSQKLAMVMLKKLWQGNRGGDALAQLSDRELQVFQLLGSGLGTRAIAQELELGIKTIETHREHIKKKLGLSNSASLTHAATTWKHTNALPSPR